MSPVESVYSFTQSKIGFSEIIGFQQVPYVSRETNPKLEPSIHQRAQG